MENVIETFNKYLFVLAHPDDEVYCCVLIKRLIDLKKDVTAIYLTSGDSGTNPSARLEELKKSMSLIGINEKNFLLLGVKESELFDKLDEIAMRAKKVGDEYLPDCVIGMDYEGGHEGHDVASLFGYLASRQADCKYYTFPVYHADKGKRIAAIMVPGRDADFTLTLDSNEKDLKINIFEAHKGQIGHFLGLQKNNPEYFKLMLTREIYRDADKIDYTLPPSTEIGYESHRNGFKYSDFNSAVLAILKR